MLAIKLSFQICLACCSETNWHADLLASLLPRLPFKRCRLANFRSGSEKVTSWPGIYVGTVHLC